MRLLAHLLGIFAVCSANPLLSLFSMGARKTSEAACRPSESEKKPEEKPCPKGSLCFPWPKLAWIKPPPMCTIPKDSKVATQTKFGKRILVAVASALLGVALLPFK